MELFLQQGTNQTFLIQLIIDYLKLTQRNKIKLIYLSSGALKAKQNGTFKVSVPSLIQKQGNIIDNPQAICKQLFSILPQWQSFFLGSNQQQQKEISQVRTNLKDPKDRKKYLQKHLQQRTFFVSNHLTLADFIMFTQLHDMMIDFTDDQKNQFCNIFRWYKHIQNLPQIRSFLQKNQRFITQDPVLKVPFVVQKKKGKQKQKKQKKDLKIQTSQQKTD